MRSDGVRSQRLGNGDRFCRTRPQRNSLVLDVPPCQECTNLRGQEDSRLVATLTQDEASGPVHSLASACICGKLGIHVHVHNEQTRNITRCVLVCLGEAQDARHINGPECQEQNEEDEGPVFGIAQEQLPLHNPAHAESWKRPQRRNPTQSQTKSGATITVAI